MKKAVAVIAVLALALTAFVAVGLAIQGAAPDSPAAEPTPSPTTPPPAAVTEAPSPSSPSSTRSASTGSPARPMTTRTAASSRCRSTTPTRRGRRSTWRCSASRPGLARRLPGGEPGRSRRPRDDVRRRGWAGVPRAAARRLRHRRLRPPRGRGLGPGRLPQRRRARRLPRRRPDARHGRGARGLPLDGAVLRPGLRRRLRPGRRPRDHDRGRPRHGRAPLGAGGGDADYFGASYGTKLGATYAELFPDKVGRFVLDGAVDVSLDAQVDVARAGHRVRDRAAGLRAELPRHDRQLLPRRHRRRGPGHDHRAARVDRGGAAARGRPRADRRQRVLRRHHPALQPRLLVPAQHRARLCAGRQGLGADVAGRRLRLAQPRRQLRRQLGGGQLLDQLPRRPASVPFGKVSSLFPEFEEASPTFGRIFAWGMALCRASTCRPARSR